MKLMKKLLCLALVAVAVVTVASCEEEDKSGIGRYTYNTAMSVFPTNWNPHAYQTETDSTILDYTTAGFYTFDYNETKDGYSVVNSMAAEKPEDVTAAHVDEKWGIEEGEEGRAYKIKLRNDIKWQDGTPITAHDFVTSAQLLLNPEAANYRADQLYSGNMVIVNSQAYLKQGKYAFDMPMVVDNEDEEYIAAADFVLKDGKYYVGEHDMAVNINNGGNWGSNSFADYAAAGYFAVYAEDENGDYIQKKDEKGNPVWQLDKEGNPAKDKEGNEIPVYEMIVSPSWTALEEAADDNGDVIITPETLVHVQNCIAVLQGFPYIDAVTAYHDALYAQALKAAQDLNADKDESNNVADPEAYAAAEAQYAYVEWEEMAFYGHIYEDVEWENVGMYAAADDELVIVLEKKLTGFYLLYSLTGSWLVHEPTYTRCESVDANGLYVNTYGTTVDTYMSYGPYKLVEFQKDKIIRFEKNPYFYELNDEYADPIYQTTHIQIDYVAEESTRLELFNQGKLDAYGLSANDMETYASSDYIYYSKGASTFYLATNPGEYYKTYDEKKENAGECKQMLNILEFRQALSFALDRASFALVTAPTNSPAIAMFSDLIISDPENGVAYRTTEEAKDVVLNFWGLADQVGEGKKYATKDEAIDSITGYDLAGAKALFNAAYDKAKAEGILEDTDKITIKVGLPSATASFYTKGYEFLVNCYTNAVKGTKLEGMLEFSKDDTIGNAFGDKLRENAVDLLFGVGWNGSALDPYGLIFAYTIPQYQYDRNTDTSKIMVDVELEGKTLRSSLYYWSYYCLGGAEIPAQVVGEDGNVMTEPVLDEEGNPVLDEAGNPKTQPVVHKISAGTDAPNETRLTIFAACENALLEMYNLIPLIDDASAALKGMQIKYYTEEYIFGVGRGGIKYMTYHFDDYAWDKHVASNNGSLNYK